ncbi:MAG: hypothetical protein K2G63_03955 [Oscillospiraceae bacterium]|nr:hypothetical protein [Oscillospiraceae bacterium]
MRDGTELELLENLRQQNVTTPFMLMSDIDDTRLEHEAQRWDGLFCCKTDYDFVTKIKSMI